MENEKLNTLPIQQYIQTVKTADNAKQKDIRLDMQTAKNLAYTLGIVMSRLNGDLEKLIISKESSAEEVIQIAMDGGTNWK